MLPIHVVTSDGSPLVTCPTCHGAPCATCHDERKVRAEVAHALEAREGAQRANEAKRVARREQRIEAAHCVFDYFLGYVVPVLLPIICAAVLKNAVRFYAWLMTFVVDITPPAPGMLDNWAAGGFVIGGIGTLIVIVIAFESVEKNFPASGLPPWMPSRRRHDRAERRRSKV